MLIVTSIFFFFNISAAEDCDAGTNPCGNNTDCTVVDSVETCFCKTGFQFVDGSNNTECEGDLTHSLIHHFETVPNSKKLQMTTEMWLMKAFKKQIA